MGAILEVSNLCKSYPGFRLKNVTFSVERGSIMGFIGRNGAGKTTTLRSILGLTHPDSGSVRCLGRDWAQYERGIKDFIGYAGGAVDYYKRKKIRDIAAVTRRFYHTWDERAYRRYLTLFSLNEDKTPAQLSQGKRVELNLVLALSHRAELLILDEPTSGLDPVARGELTDVFKYLRAQRVAILFSTHITSDLERCADGITYLRNGEVVVSEALGDFLAFHRMNGDGETLEEIMLRFEGGGSLNGTLSD